MLLPSVDIAAVYFYIPGSLFMSAAACIKREVLLQEFAALCALFSKNNVYPLAFFSLTV